jgi:predicted FMN-binding regulatory protein PaiB
MPLSNVFTAEDELLLFALFTATVFAVLVFGAANELFASTMKMLEIKRSRERARLT